MLFTVNYMSDREDKMSSIKEYRFFRSFSTKIENWSQRKAEALWGKMREKKIAGIVNLDGCV